MSFEDPNKIRDFSKEFKEREKVLDEASSGGKAKPKGISKKLAQETGLPESFTHKELSGYRANELEHIAKLKDHPETIGEEGSKMTDAPKSLTWDETLGFKRTMEEAEEKVDLPLAKEEMEEEESKGAN